MKTLLKKLILSFVLIFATSMNIGAKVVSYPVPQTEPLSSDYTVEVNGITIPVYTASTPRQEIFNCLLRFFGYGNDYCKK